ncbi:hypothetical protein NPA08_02230 [Mycoplasmopsis citelli]|uniref:ATP-binding protein n=1 Tax=Mycoplasmopsis citelli TaxID=171281 RepID=UPI0021155375|nr:ATP-binding protein [Mycoplasmopsis citelli]UUD36622.1 hypothetical protein NPA08_02230 [Mycoplasmopsis citelli]
MILAAILLFGNQQIIEKVLPYYETEALVKLFNKDRSDDRETVNTNLIDSYFKLNEFGKKHLKDLFVLDNDRNVNARDWILREIISNTLMHRNFNGKETTRIIIYEDKIVVENPNIPYKIGNLDLNNPKSIAKNSPIFKVFREIGFADELGSGIVNTLKFTKLYSGKELIFEEGDTFTTTIPLKKIATLKVGVYSVSKISNKQLQEFIKQQIRENPNITIKEISQKLVEVKALF